MNIAGAALALGAAWGLGRALWRFEPPSETLAFASGTAGLSLISFLLLAAGVGRPVPMVIVALGLAGLLAVKRPRWPALPRPDLGLALCTVYGVVYVICALAPEIQPDALTYHTGLPTRWLESGGFGRSTGFYDVMPLGLETIFAVAMAAGGKAALVHLAFLLMTVPLVLDVARRLELPRWAAWAASVMYLTAPIAGVTGTSAYTDAALTFACAAVFDLALRFRRGRSRTLALHAGLLAGFCYGVKITGFVVLVPLVLACGWTAGAAALTGIVPWVARAAMLTGNPFAPMLNAWFPNGSFHVASEQVLSHYLRSYGGVSAAGIPWALCVEGAKLQGLLGPVFLLAPVALLSLRRRPGRILLGVSAVLALPWAMNIGTRFLMPALPWVALAMASVVPRPAAWALAVVQAVLAWPAVTGMYADRWAWRIREIPWQAAFRVEPAATYRNRVLGDYPVAQVVNRHLKRESRLLDLYALPYSMTAVLPLGSLPNAQFDNMAEALELAGRQETDTLYEVRTHWAQEFVRAVRVRLDEAPGDRWSVNEIELLRDGVRVAARPEWVLEAWPNAWDAPLALDGIDVSRWNTWEKSRAGMFVEVRFDRPAPLDEAAVVFSRPDGPFKASVYRQTMDGRWHRAGGTESAQPRNGFDRKLDAARFARRSGLEYLLVGTESEGFAKMGRLMAANPAGWGLEKVECVGRVCLFRWR